MPPVQRGSVAGLAAAGALAVAVVFSGSVSGTHGQQRWAGQWDFVHGANSPTPGLQGGFAFRHETDDFGAELLENIGGVACPEPTDYFAGGYTIPDGTPASGPPPEEFLDTGKIRGCTVGDPEHLSGRYESNFFPAARGDIELVLDPSGDHWTGTFQPDGDPNQYSWSGFFDQHFGDGAEEPSIPPYGEEPPEEPPPAGGGPPAPPAEDKTKCEGKEATITPNPDAPPGFAISGTAADDVIVGTDGDDRILGLGGNDVICGFGGNDELIGAEGNDTIHGGLGSDMVDGGSGDDHLYGEVFQFEKVVMPSGGNDQLFGGDGNDYLEGGPGNDSLFGGEGNGRALGRPLPGCAWIQGE